MWRKAKNLIGNLLISAAAVTVCFLILEFGVFAYVLVPDDVIRNVTTNDVVRYEPNTRAVFRNPDGSKFLVTINADGWNSTKPSYKVERTPGVLRVALIGDSYVQAATVNVQDNFAEVIQRELNRRGVKAEVYRFGMDGAPLSQYLHVLRKEVLRYKPDLVLVQLIHNDFDESYRQLSTRYASSFLKVEPDGKGGFVELPPHPFQRGFADIARDFRTFRYLYYETGLYQRLGGLNKLWWGGAAHAATPELVSSAVDIRNIQDHDTIRAVSRYILQQMKQVADANGIKIAFAMDGVREAVYADRPASDYAVGALNEIVADLMDELHLPFIDLQDTFAQDYRRHHKRFEYNWDWHWNARANALVGATLTDFLLRDPRLLRGGAGT